MSGGTIALSTVNVELDGNAAEGVLTFATDGRQTLQGTLAADELDLTPYISTVRLLTSNERDWNRVPISLDGLSGFDLDLRLSAARIAIAARQARPHRHRRQPARRQARRDDRRSAGVRRRAQGLVRPRRLGARRRLQVPDEFIDVDLENCLGELFNFRRIEGRGNLALNIDASGASVLALTRGMNGTASLIGRQGALTGLNVEQLLRRLERRPLSGAGDFRSGRTPFEKLTAIIKITQGEAMVEEMRIEGPKVRLGVVGTASIPGREFDLRGVAALVSTAGRATPAFELPFVVQGPWDDPIMLPDTQMLILRSPVASPLLEAVKNRNTRDTVRSAIERLTGSAPSAPAAAAGPPRPAHSSPVRRPSRAASARFDYHSRDESPRPQSAGDEAAMLHPLVRTLVKIAVASLIVGSVLAHFGISAER